MKLNFEKIYKEFDIKVGCEGCSKCCEKAEFVALLPFEKEYLCSKIPDASKHIISNVIHNTKAYFIPQPCPFLKKGLCSIVENRPFDCRAFPINFCIFKDKIITYAYDKNCPAFNKMDKKHIQEISEYVIKIVSMLDKTWIKDTSSLGPCGNCKYKPDCDVELDFDDEDW